MDPNRFDAIVRSLDRPATRRRRRHLQHRRRNVEPYQRDPGHPKQRRARRSGQPGFADGKRRQRHHRQRPGRLLPDRIGNGLPGLSPPPKDSARAAGRLPSARAAHCNDSRPASADERRHLRRRGAAPGAMLESGARPCRARQRHPPSAAASVQCWPRSASEPGSSTTPMPNPRRARKRRSRSRARQARRAAAPPASTANPTPSTAAAAGVRARPGRPAPAASARPEAPPVARNGAGGRASTRTPTRPHCGACGNACNGDLTCLSGECGCAAGTRCGNQCVDVQTDPGHCGACADPCGAGEACVGGQCATAIACTTDVQCWSTIAETGGTPTCQGGFCRCGNSGPASAPWPMAADVATSAAPAAARPARATGSAAPFRPGLG